MNLPHKKMIREQSFLGFTGICDCGEKHKFKPNDIDLNKSHSNTVFLNKIYTCPECKTTYDGMFDISETKNWKQFSPVGIVASLILVLGLGYGGYKTIKWATHSDPVEKSPEQIIIDEQNNWDNKN